MTRGRKPKPGAAGPKPPDALPRCPDHLCDAARKEWRRLATPPWRMGVLTVCDRAALAAYCQAWARWVSTSLNRAVTTAPLERAKLSIDARCASSPNPDWPELAKALNAARVTGATLAIARLDRLSRNAAFLLTLRDSGVRFIACDMPASNVLTVGVLALVAEAEREAISRRTKEALAMAKARGVRLGNPNGAAALLRSDDGGRSLRQTVSQNADCFARDLAPVVEDIRTGGPSSLRAIAAELNARGILTRRGARWHVSNVRNLLARLER